MNKRKMIAIVSVVVALFSAMIYHFTYPIELNMLTLPQHITDAYNRGYSVQYEPNVEIFRGITLGNDTYYLIEIDEDLGYVSLEEGIFGGYKINHLGYGDSAFRQGLVEHDGTTYFLMGGRDITEQIASIQVVIDHKPYAIEISSKGTHFFEVIPVDAVPELSLFYVDGITFYNDIGEDITAQYDWSSGGIQ